MSRFLVYGLADPLTNEIFYVGKSHRGFDKAVRHGAPWHLRVDRNLSKVRRIARILCAGQLPQVWPIAWARNRAELAALETQIIRQWTRAGVQLSNKLNNRS